MLAYGGGCSGFLFAYALVDYAKNNGLVPYLTKPG